MMSHQSSVVEWVKKANEPQELHLFQIVKQVGEGGFGKVYLVQNTRNGKQYAMKAVRKDRIIQ